MTILSKLTPKNDPPDPPVNAVKNWKSLKGVEMMSVECIMVVFDGSYLLELIYLAKYAKISHFQLFSIHSMWKWLKLTFCLLPTCSTPQRKLEFAGELSFTIRMISWNFDVGYNFSKLKWHDSQGWASDRKGLVIFNPALGGWSTGEGVKSFWRPAWWGWKNCTLLLRGLEKFPLK